MENKHNLLIVEKSTSALTAVASENKDYVLEGVFGQIDQKNRNNRIYTEAEYVPQIEALQAKIKSSKLLGELDHPTQFDTSLKNVSHVIEELYYDKDTKEVRGKIKLLDTDAGRQAKALVDAGVPLQISSRAAGAVESNGQVKIKQLFTYDLVADPGFENAELTRVNESYGFANDESLFIYEMGKSNSTTVEQIENTNTQIKENKNMAEFVKAEDFNKYSEYLANEIKSLKESINSKESNDGVDLKTVTAHNDHIAENVNSLAEYVNYVATKLDESISYTEHVAEKADQGIAYTEHVAEKADQGIAYSEHVAEKADQGIAYSEHVAEKLDASISYTEHVSEAVAKVKDFANYLAEAHNEGVDTKENLVAYVEYLKENLQAVSEYTEYIAESINESLVEEVEEPAKEAGEAEETDEIENIGDNTEEGDVEDETGDSTEAEDLEDGTVKSDSEIEDETEEVEAGEGDEEAEGEDGMLDPLEAYKNEISSKLDALVESATIKNNENPTFFKVVSSTTREKYNSLTESAKTEVRATVAKRGFMTESEIVSLMNNAELILENAGAQPFFIEAMPTEYATAWNNLSEAKQTQIAAQAKYHTLNTEYQVANFWQTRDLREAPVAMEQVGMIAESRAAQAEAKTLGYDVSGYADAFKKRFNK